MWKSADFEAVNEALLPLAVRAWQVVSADLKQASSHGDNAAQADGLHDQFLQNLIGELAKKPM